MKPAPASPKLEWFGLGSFLKRFPPLKQRWLCERLLPATGVHLLAGQPHVGKTRFTLALATALSSGEEFCGLTTKQVRTIYIHERDPHLTSHKLREAWRGAGCKKLGITIVTPPVDLIDNDVVQELIGLVREKRAGLVVVDTLRRAASYEENSAREVSALLGQLRRLAVEGECAVLGIHHFSRGGKEIRGSGDFEGGTDSYITLTKTKRDDVVQVHAHHHEAGSEKFHAQYTHQNGGVTVARSAAPATKSGTEIEDAVLRACTRGPLGLAALRNAVRADVGKAANTSIDAAATALVARKKLVDTGNGRQHRFEVAK